MKKLVLLLALVVSISANAQLTPKPSTISYGIGHINETGDTLYILADMFAIMHKIWNLPSNIDEKPVLIPVESIIALKSPLIGKEEE